MGLASHARADSFVARPPGYWQKQTVQRDGEIEVTLYADKKSKRQEMIVLQSESISDISADAHEKLIEKRNDFSQTRAELFALSGINGYAVVDMRVSLKKPRAARSLVVIQSRFVDFQGREVQMLERQYVVGHRLLTATYLLEAPALNDRSSANRILDFFEPKPSSDRMPSSIGESKSGTPAEGALNGASSSAAGDQPFKMRDPLVQANCQEFCKKDPTRCQIKDDPGFQQAFSSQLQTGWGCFVGLKDGLLNMYQTLIWKPLNFAWDYGKSWLTDGKYKEQVHAGVGSVVAEAWKSPSAFVSRIAYSLWHSAGQALGDWFYCANSKEQVREVCSFATNFIPIGLLWKMITRAKMSAAELAEVNAAFRKGAGTGQKLSPEEVAALNRSATEIAQEKLSQAPETIKPKASGRGAENSSTEIPVKGAMVKQYYALLTDAQRAELNEVLKRGGKAVQDDFEKVVLRGQGNKVRQVLERKLFGQSWEQRQAALATLIRDLAAGDSTAYLKARPNPLSPKVGRERSLEAESLESLAQKTEQLAPQARIMEAQKVLGRALSPTEQAVVLDAHEVGAGARGADKKTLARIGNYSVPQLREKAEILRKAGFNERQRRKLMERGIVGEDARMDFNIVKHRNNEWAVHYPEPPTAAEKVQPWAKGGEWQYFVREGSNEIHLAYYKESFTTISLETGELSEIPDVWLDRNGKKLNLTRSDIASHRKVDDALKSREFADNHDDEFLKALQRMATEKWHPLASGKGITIVGSDKNLKRAAERLHEDLTKFDSYLENMGFKKPRDTRVILDENGPAMGPFAFPAPLYSTRDIKLYNRTIAMNPLGEFKAFITNHSTALHERVHTVLFTTYSNEARINSLNLASYQEAIADFLSGNYLNSPKIAKDAIYEDSSLRNMKRRMTAEGVSGQRKLKNALDLGTDDHHDSLIYSHTFWRLRETLGKEKMDRVFKAFVDDLNHHAEDGQLLMNSIGSDLRPRKGPAFQMEAENLAYFLASLRRTAESKGVSEPVNKVIDEIASSFIINPRRIDEFSQNMRPKNNYERKGSEIRVTMEINAEVLKDQLKHAGTAAAVMGAGGGIVIYEVESSAKK